MKSQLVNREWSGPSLVHVGLGLRVHREGKFIFTPLWPEGKKHCLSFILVVLALAFKERMFGPQEFGQTFITEFLLYSRTLEGTFPSK